MNVQGLIEELLQLDPTYEIGFIDTEGYVTRVDALFPDHFTHIVIFQEES